MGVSRGLRTPPRRPSSLKGRIQSSDSDPFNPLPIGLSELRKRLGGGPLWAPLIFFTFKATIGV